MMPRDGRFGDPLGARIIKPKTPQERRLDEFVAKGCFACGRLNVVFDLIGPTPQTSNGWMRCRCCLAAWEIDPQGNIVNRKTVLESPIERFAHETKELLK